MSQFPQHPLDTPAQAALDKVVQAIDGAEHLSAGLLLEIERTGIPNNCSDMFKITIQVFTRIPRHSDSSTTA